MDRLLTLFARFRRGLACSVAATLLCGAAVDSAFGQTLSVRGGTGLSSVHLAAGDDFGESTSLAPGITAGVVLVVALPFRLSIQAEGQFVLERAKAADTVESRFRYLDVPVMVARAVPMLTVRQRAVTVEAGAVYRRLLSATDSFGGESFSITDGVKADDVLLAVGADVPVAPRWSIDVRYLHGQNGVYRRFDGRYAGRWRSVQIAARYALWE